MNGAIQITPQPPMPTGDCCGKCKFFFSHGNERVCRREPPTVLAIPAGGKVQLISHFPPMQRNGWCGEFQGLIFNSRVVDLPMMPGGVGPTESGN